MLKADDTTDKAYQAKKRRRRRNKPGCSRLSAQSKGLLLTKAVVSDVDAAGVAPRQRNGINAHLWRVDRHEITHAQKRREKRASSGCNPERREAFSVINLQKGF